MLAGTGLVLFADGLRHRRGLPRAHAYSRPMMPCSEVISVTIFVTRSALARNAAR